MSGNESQRIGFDQVRRIRHFRFGHPRALGQGVKAEGAIGHVARQGFLHAIAIEGLRETIMRVPHVDVSEEVVKAHVVWIGQVIRRSNSPLQVFQYRKQMHARQARRAQTGDDL